MAESETKQLELPMTAAANTALVGSRFAEYAMEQIKSKPKWERKWLAQAIRNWS